VVAPLDIFKLDAGGVTWIAEANTLAHATEIIRKRGSGRYLVLSHTTGHKEKFDVHSDGSVHRVTDLVDSSAT